VTTRSDLLREIGRLDVVLRDLAASPQRADVLALTRIARDERSVLCERLLAVANDESAAGVCHVCGCTHGYAHCGRDEGPDNDTTLGTAEGGLLR